MTAFERKIHIQSRAKCCNDARAIMKFTLVLSWEVRVSNFRSGQPGCRVERAATGGVQGVVKSVDRFHRACKMS
jgi:hypothetical protein